MDKLEFLRKFKTFDEWYEIVGLIIESEEFQKRKLFLHHENTSVYEHSCAVSLKSFVYAKRLGLDARVAAIAGLLHDFYPKAWIYNEELASVDPGACSEFGVKKTFFRKHGFVHAKEAALNYQKFYPDVVNLKITDSIKKHMFPLTLVPPRYPEGWIVTWADKMCTFNDAEFIMKMPSSVIKWVLKNK